VGDQKQSLTKKEVEGKAGAGGKKREEKRDMIPKRGQQNYGLYENYGMV